MDLKTPAIRSTAWYAATRLRVQGISWALKVILVRLLPPQDYGLFAMALTVIAFS
jgi:O-antigen/teichoic acid export membrane protein